MKKIFLSLSLSTLSFLFLHAQNTTSGTTGQNNSQAVIPWKANGNQAADEHFIGTVNEKPLIFKSNSLEGLRLTPEGDVRFDRLKIDTSQNTDNFRIAVINDRGVISVIDKLELARFVSDVGQDCLQSFDDDDDGSSSRNFTSNSTSGYGNPIPIWQSEPGKIYTGSDCPAKVGINTAFPTSALTVKGHADISSLNVRGGSELEGRTRVRSDLPSTASIDMFSVFNGNNVNVFSAASDGSIRIGVTPNTDKAIRVYNNLQNKDVFRVMGNGDVWANNITVTLPGNYPDYVFENEYKLMPLYDLEAFIIKNKHLPNIPKASYVEEHGMDLGELSRLQMEKIEELTLYIIEIQKRVNKLEEENKSLKQKFEQLEE